MGLLKELREGSAFKTVYSGNNTYLVFNIKKKEAINYQQIRAFDEEEIYRKYFVRFQCTKNGSINKVSYDISGMTSLSEYLKGNLQQNDYFKLLSDIQEIVSFCQAHSLPLGNIVYNPNYIYYHNTMRKVLMAYVPVREPNYLSYSIQKSLVTMHEIAKKTMIKQDENYLSSYEEFLSELSYTAGKAMRSEEFSPDSLLHFFNENKRNYDSVKLKGSNFNPAPKPEVSHFSIMNQIQNQSVQQPSGQLQNQSVNPAPSQLSGRLSDRTLKYDAVTEVQCEGTVVVGRSVQSETPQPVQEKKTIVSLTDDSGRKTIIEKFPFRIGRAGDNDLIIEHETVSGHHAVIAKNGENYILYDNNSTNGTFINDSSERITEYTLSGGEKITFESINFKFSAGEEDSEPKPETAPPPSVQGTTVVQRKVEVPEKYAAYLTAEDGTIIGISEFPFEVEEGIRITSETTADKTIMLIENVSCPSLIMHNFSIGKGMKTEIFSGCCLEINNEKYVFKVEN